MTSKENEFFDFLDLLFFITTLVGIASLISSIFSYIFGNQSYALYPCPNGYFCDIRLHGVSLDFVITTVILLSVSGAYETIKKFYLKQGNKIKDRLGRKKPMTAPNLMANETKSSALKNCNARESYFCYG